MPTLGQAAAFREGLAQLGYLEHRNYIVEYRWNPDDVSRLRTVAAQLAASVDLIIAPGNRAIAVAQEATTAVPIVMPWSIDPVGSGFAASLARLGGNVTGLSFDVATEQVSKHLELFKELMPTLSRMAALWDAKYPGSDKYWPPARAAAAALRIQMQEIDVADDRDLHKTFGVLTQTRPDAVFVWGDPITYTNRMRIAEFAIKRRLPTLPPAIEFAETGCLMVYGANVYDLFGRAAHYVDRIFKGAKPGDLPIEYQRRRSSVRPWPKGFVPSVAVWMLIRATSPCNS